MAHCKLKNCPYDRDGRCVENQLPNCPNLVEDSPAASPKKPEVPEPTPPPTHEPLHSGKKLNTEEAAAILQSNPQMVVLGGMVESGKTTLLARIFEMFQCGEITNYRFMATLTPIEFDKISWHATMECGGAHPTTEHTYRPENNLFLHLRIRPDNDSGRPVHLLLADIPGEIFPEAVAEESVCRDLKALRRANHVVLFLNSGVLCDAAKRHDHCSKVFDFVSRALQTGQIGQHTVLHLVISRCDLLHKDKALSAETLRFVELTERAFRTKFAARVGDLHICRLAARPEHPYPATLTAINEIFHLWTTRPKPHDISAKPLHPSSFHRDFCRFRL